MRHKIKIFYYYKISCKINILLLNRPDFTPSPNNVTLSTSALSSELRLQSSFPYLLSNTIAMLMKQGDGHITSK